MALKLANLTPQMLRAVVRKLRFQRSNAGFQPEIVSKTIGGVTFDFLLGDVTGRDWYRDQDGISPELAFLRDRMIAPGDRVLECGAHHGFTTILIAHWIGPSGRLTAFEASPSSAEILSRNIELNRLGDRVTVEAKAVGSRAGSLTFTDESNAVALTAPFAPGSRVPVVPLDDYAHLSPTLLKLDVEGFEIEVLRGAERVLRRRPKLAIEVHVDMLRRYGRRADDLLELVPPTSYDLWIQLGADETPRPYAGERLADQRMDQVHLYALPRAAAR